MTQTILLHPQPVTLKILAQLEMQGCIRLLKPTEKIMRSSDVDAVDTLYQSTPASGAHKLICVRKSTCEIQLTVHSENDDLIFLNTSEKYYRPLYMIIGIHDVAVLEEKARSATLSDHDFVTLEIEYNNPATCYFTLLRSIPHCEITIPGNDEAPIFFVTEPSEISMRFVDLPHVDFTFAQLEPV